MTVSRTAQLTLFLSLMLAVAGLPMRAQEPAAAPASQPAAPAPKRAKAAEDAEDRPARPRRKPTPAPAPASAAATPKPGFFKRVFGPNRKPPATQAPAATPTPKPKPRVKKDDDEETKPKPRKDDDEETKPKKPVEKPGAEIPAPGDSGEPNLTVKPPKATPAPKATPVPRGKKGAVSKELGKTLAAGAAKEQLALEHAVRGGDAETIEKARYDYARARAVEDEHVRDLKAEADGATSEEEGRKSLRAYNRALFDRMRKLEPAVSERIDRMEAAVLKRIGSGEE